MTRAVSPCACRRCPEIVTYGKDEREALTMAEDAIQLVIADSIARGEPLPADTPSRIREVTVTLRGMKSETAGGYGARGHPRAGTRRLRGVANVGQSLPAHSCQRPGAQGDRAGAQRRPRAGYAAGYRRAGGVHGC